MPPGPGRRGRGAPMPPRGRRPRRRPRPPRAAPPPVDFRTPRARGAVLLSHRETCVIGQPGETVTVMLARRSDITVEAFKRVAWQRAPVEIAPSAIAVIDRCHSSFEAFIAQRLASDPNAQIYSITFGPG